MRLVFLAPLLTGLLSIYICRKSQDELAYLTGAIAGVTLLASLMLAPWQVQLFLLILGSSTIGYIWKQRETDNTIEVQQFQATVSAKAKLMKEQKPASVLSSSITLEPSAEIDKRKLRKYRGVVMEEIASKPAPKPSNLKYRGADVDSSNS